MSLSGLCFAITGALSVGRSEFEELVTSNGGTFAKSVNDNCTHLIRFSFPLLTFL
jgi:NAD-dependent DNA ligase